MLRRGLLLVLLGAPALAQPSRAIEHRTASAHPMQYEVARPEGWKAGGAYPIVVVIPDATRAFRENLQAFIAARKGSPFILVAPQVLTSGGASVSHELFGYSKETWASIDRDPFAFDEAGIAAVLADVRAKDAGNATVFLTGWEAGGHTVWGLLFRHPDWFRAVAPVSANYQGRWLGKAPPGAARPAVKIFFCGPLQGDEEKGRQAWFTQSRRAIDEARTRGFPEIPLEELPGRPHGPLAEEVLQYFRSFAK